MRYVINQPGVGYFSEFEITETVPVLAPVDIPPNIKKGDPIAHVSHALPKFEAGHAKLAAKFNTEADAQAQLSNPDPNLGGPAAFAGCIVESTNT